MISIGPLRVSRNSSDATPVPVAIPIGAEKDFKGVVDIIHMKAFTYTPDGDGKGREIPIPDELADRAKALHESLIESIAEGRDELMEEFFETGTLPRIRSTPGCTNC